MAKKLVEIEKDVKKQTAKICFGCKHGLCSSAVYCGKLRRCVEGVMYCPSLRVGAIRIETLRKELKRYVGFFQL